MPDRVEPDLTSAYAAALPRVTRVIGGARSGKSRYAETLIEAAAPSALYLATAEARDPEMAERIGRHRARRDPRWTTVEEPRALRQALAREARANRPMLVECLTLWVSNLLEAGSDVAAETAALAASLPLSGGSVVFVANEVGLGIVPDTPLARAFRDHAGRLNQAIAARADRVVFIAAGLPLMLKDTTR